MIVMDPEQAAYFFEDGIIPDHVIVKDRAEIDQDIIDLISA